MIKPHSGTQMQLMHVCRGALVNEGEEAQREEARKRKDTGERLGEIDAKGRGIYK